VALSSGIYSLIGVAVGSLSTGGFQLGLAVRSDRRDSRAAKRHVAALLRDASFVMDRMIEDGPSLSALATLQRVSGAWPNFSDRLGHDLSDSKWAYVEGAFAVIRRISDALSAGTLEDPTPVLRTARPLVAEGLRQLRRNAAAPADAVNDGGAEACATEPKADVDPGP
jgi:hypothetical protein